MVPYGHGTYCCCYRDPGCLHFQDEVTTPWLVWYRYRNTDWWQHLRITHKGGEFFVIKCNRIWLAGTGQGTCTKYGLACVWSKILQWDFLEHTCRHSLNHFSLLDMQITMFHTFLPTETTENFTRPPHKILCTTTKISDVTVTQYLESDVP